MQHKEKKDPSHREGYKEMKELVRLSNSNIWKRNGMWRYREILIWNLRTSEAQKITSWRNGNAAMLMYIALNFRTLSFDFNHASRVVFEESEHKSEIIARNKRRFFEGNCYFHLLFWGNSQTLWNITASHRRNSWIISFYCWLYINCPLLYF